MKRFALKTKLGEVINYVFAIDIDEAIDKFSIRKQINSTDLMLIFNVEVE